jgi:hypothetical protein
MSMLAAVLDQWENDAFAVTWELTASGDMAVRISPPPYRRTSAPSLYVVVDQEVNNMEAVHRYFWLVRDSVTDMASALARAGV